MRLQVKLSPTFIAGPVIPLFRLPGEILRNFGDEYDVSPDGQRFLLNMSAEKLEPPAITLVLQWTRELNR